MFCGHCGSEVKDGARFCPGCGAPVAAGAAAAAQPQQAYQQPQQQYAQPQYAQQPYQQAQYVQAVPLGAKSKIAAGLLAIFLGSLGIHKFYLGYTKEGVIMLVVTLVGGLIFGLGAIAMAIIALIEGILYLTKTDQEFYQIYEVGQKGWF